MDFAFETAVLPTFLFKGNGEADGPCYTRSIAFVNGARTLMPCHLLQMGQSGVMNLGALTDRLSGCMGSGRAVLVDEAFDRLDTSGQGHLTLDKVAHWWFDCLMSGRANRV